MSDFPVWLEDGCSPVVQAAGLFIQLSRAFRLQLNCQNEHFAARSSAIASSDFKTKILTCSLSEFASLSASSCLPAYSQRSPFVTASERFVIEP